jgi:hypothetical protein
VVAPTHPSLRVHPAYLQACAGPKVPSQKSMFLSRNSRQGM